MRDADEDEHLPEEVDPRFRDEGEEDRAHQQALPDDPWHDDRWVEVEVEANPTIQRRFQLPTPAPYIPDVDIPGVGGKEFNEVTNIRCPLSSEKE